MVNALNNVNRTEVYHCITTYNRKLRIMNNDISIYSKLSAVYRNFCVHI